jgi:glycosyltransferase involved in cell wall biosynthesis
MPTSDLLADAPDLAVVVPAYNECDAVTATLVRLQAVLASLPCRSEIVLVDDGSTDGTGARAAAVPGIRVITHATNQGYGAALRSGILATAARAVAIIDADGSYAPEAIPRLYDGLAHADMVVGARRLQSSGVAWNRRPGKWLLNRFASYLADRDIPDLNSGQRVMRREALVRYLHLTPSGFSFTSTITLALISNGYHVIYEPIDYVRRAGRSKLRAAHFASFLLLVVRAIVLFNPLKVFLPLGAILFVIGLVKLAQDIVARSMSETAVMAFLAALVVWAVGLLADMISRLNMQPPWRP